MEIRTMMFDLDDRKRAEEMTEVAKNLYPECDVTIKEVETEDSFGRTGRALKLTIEEYEEVDLDENYGYTCDIAGICGGTSCPQYFKCHA